MRRPRAGHAAGAAMLMLALAGCSAQSSATSSVTISGNSLAIYMSAPAGYKSDPVLADTIDAELLAYSQLSSHVTAFHLDDHLLSTGELSSHARTAISDKTSVAYIGELQPGASEQTAGITEAQDLLTVSPTDTAVELTQKTPAVADSPKYFYESLSTYGKTFARIAPNSVVEAKAIVTEMKTLGVTSVSIRDDQSDYGKAIADAVALAAHADGINPTAPVSSAGAVFYGGTSASGAVQTFTAAKKANPTIKAFGSSGLDSAAFLAALGSASANVYVSAPAIGPTLTFSSSTGTSGAAGATGTSGATGTAVPTPAPLTPTGSTPTSDAAFVQAFQAKYGHVPASQAVFGYEAMSAVIASIVNAGHDADNRRAVVRAFFSITNRNSQVGSYSIGAGGDSSLTAFQFLTVKNGAFAPGATVQG